MKYKIRGSVVTLTLDGDEITEIIEALELRNPESELLNAFRQYREQEFAKP
jgi:hypothetical protein